MFSSDIIRRGLISRSVGNNMENDEKDVLAVKNGLSRTGFFDFSSNTTEPHGIITRQMDDGVKAFQKAKGLRVDGLLYPKGETEGALRQAVGTGFKGPNTEVMLPESQEVLKPKQVNCGNQEVAWINAEAALFVAKQKLSQAQAKLANLEKQLSELRVLRKKETSVISGDNGTARNFGGAAGLIIGGLLAGPLGAAAGLGAGASLGPVIEEGVDVATGNKTDIQIGFEIQNMAKRIAELKENIENVLKSEVSKSSDVAQKAKLKLMECKRKK